MATKSLVRLATLLGASLGLIGATMGLAAAQGYYPPPPQPGYPPPQPVYPQPQPAPAYAPPPTYAPQPAYAPPPQQYAPAPAQQYGQSLYGNGDVKPRRNGLTAGGSLGLGAITFDQGEGKSESRGGVSGGGFIGGYLNPNLAIMFDVEVTSFRVGSYYDDTYISQVIGTAAAKLHMGETIWLKGGLGFGKLVYDSPEYQDESNAGAAVMFGVGFEVFQRPHHSVDIQFNAAFASYDNGTPERQKVGNIAALVGFNWY